MIVSLPTKGAWETGAKNARSHLHAYVHTREVSSTWGTRSSVHFGNSNQASVFTYESRAMPRDDQNCLAPNKGPNQEFFFFWKGKT